MMAAPAGEGGGAAAAAETTEFDVVLEGFGELLTDDRLESWKDWLLMLCLMALVLATASGKPARTEENSCQGIAIFKTGVTL